MIKKVSGKLLIKLILPLIIFLLTLYTTFWFVKSNKIENGIKKLLDSQKKELSYTKISSSGFPLKHQFEVENLNINFDTSFAGGDIKIQKIIAKAGILSNKLNLQLVGDISLDSNSQKRFIKYSKTPNIELVFDKLNFKNISYSDNGYEVVDESANVLFKSSASSYYLDMSEDDAIIIKVQFNNMSGFDLFPKSTKILDTTKGNIVESEISEASSPDGSKTAKIKNKLPDTSIVKSVKNKPKILETDKSLNLDLKIFKNKDDKRPMLEAITKIVINNIRLSFPLFKINLSGEIKEFKILDLDLNLKLENLDGILIYIREVISNILPADFNTSQENRILEKSEDKKPLAADISNTDISNTDISNTDILDPQKIISDLIFELAVKNSKSTDKISQFDIKGSLFNLTINKVAMIDIFNKLEPLRALAAQKDNEGSIADSSQEDGSEIDSDF